MITIIEALIITIIVVGFVLCLFFGIRNEKLGFNNGKCIACGRNLKLFDYDSLGGRGYKCKHCGYTTWVSYRCVDGRGGIR